MKQAGNKIVKHASIYMLGDVLRQSVSIIMLPIYTRYLTPEDYGVVSLLSMIIDFSAIVFGARAGQAIFRFYCTAESQDEKKSVISTALFLSLLLNAIGTIVVMALSGPLAVTVFSDYSYKSFILLFAITLFLTPMFQIPLLYIRATQKPWLFFFFSILKLALQLGLNIYFIVHLEMRVEGVIYSAIISNLVMAILLLAYTLPRTGIRFSMEKCRNLFSFSLPLKLATIGSFYVTFGDRYVLNIYTDLSQVGIYTLGYKFGFIFTILAWTPFEKMWDSEKYNIHGKQDAKAAYQRIFLTTSTFLILIGLCISLFVKDLLKIMSDPAYLDAYKVVPIIIVAYVFQAWSKFCNFGILLENKTIQIAYAEMFAAAIITIAYFGLIPAFGIYGAAWATVIGFAARFYWINRKGKVYYDMQLPWSKIIITAALALALFIPSLFITEDMLVSILLRTGLLITFVLLFFSLPILSSSEKSEVWRLLRKPKRSN